MKKKIKNIKFKKKKNSNGELIFVESKKFFKSGFKRFFSVSVNKKTTRGLHSHYKSTQLLFSLNGNIFVEVYKKEKQIWKKYLLKKNINYHVIPPNNILKIKYSKPNSILGVLSDRYYDPKDYNYNKD